MSKSELPEPWRSALERKGISSIRGLAAKADISPMAASRLVKGEGTSVETVNAVAWFVFDDDVEYVWSLRGLTGIRDRGHFDLPPEAGLLTSDQRDAVVAVVRAMLSQEVKDALAGRRPQRHSGRGDVDTSKLSEQDRRELEALELERQQEGVRRQREKPAAETDERSRETGA